MFFITVCIQTQLNGYTNSEKSFEAFFPLSNMELELKRQLI